MWLISPVFTTILIWVLWSLMVMGLIWAPKLGKKDSRYECPFVIFLRGGLFSVMTYISIALIDVFIRILFLGEMGYGNIGYHIMPLLLALLSAGIFIFAAVFNAPTKQSMITFALTIGLYGFLGRDDLYTPLIYVIAIQLGMALLFIAFRKIMKQNPPLEPPMWDITPKFKVFFRPRMIIFIWIVVTIEFIAMFEGYSFFAFGPGDQTITQVCLDIAWIAFVVGWIIWDRWDVKSKLKKHNNEEL